MPLVDNAATSEQGCEPKADVPAARLVVFDAYDPGECEHFASLLRWLTACLPSASLIADSNRTRDRARPTDVVFVHGAPVDSAGSVGGSTGIALATARRIVSPHRMGAGSRECVPDDVIEALREALPQLLGRDRAFHILPGVVGCCSRLSAAASEVRLVAGSDAICLLQGETGTGKELFARAIHYWSPRRDHPFVPVNCGAIPDPLFENELFGHMRGAYTDAKTQSRGLLAHAEGGTLFLDEVDCLSALAQVKLLRVLQEGEYRPVGAARSIKADVRIVAATNSDLHRRVRQHEFREDLFHRLNVLRLSIPPLRERAGDLPLLARWFVRRFAIRYKRPLPCISQDAYDAIVQYPWPGNVREMQAMLERAVVLSRSGTIVAADLDIPCAPGRNPGAPSMKRAKEQAILHFERSYLADVLARCDGNVSRAARIAGKERRTFQRLLQKHSLSRKAFGASE